MCVVSGLCKVCALQCVSVVSLDLVRCLHGECVCGEWCLRFHTVQCVLCGVFLREMCAMWKAWLW